MIFQDSIGNHFIFPTGMILFFTVLAFAMWAFLHTKTGTAMTAVGSNPVFARASGIDVDRIRTLSVVLSTWLGAIGILVYQQSFWVHPALHGTVLHGSSCGIGDSHRRSIGEQGFDSQRHHRNILSKGFSR